MAERVTSPRVNGLEPDRRAACEAVAARLTPTYREMVNWRGSEDMPGGVLYLLEESSGSMLRVHIREDGTVSGLSLTLIVTADVGVERTELTEMTEKVARRVLGLEG